MLTGGLGVVDDGAAAVSTVFGCPLFDAPLFVGLEAERAMVVAVSGGPDSMALMLLADRWAATLGDLAPALWIATVDHGLRAEAREEAALVARTAKALGRAHEILSWDGPKPATRIQERARVARYRLLADYALRVGAGRILTGHHADDQAETILFRLGRGSGLSGLAGMSRDHRLDEGTIVTRPLLAHSKDELVMVCRYENQAFVDDPSNVDAAYVRTRLRAQVKAQVALGLDRASILRLGRRMARADAALEAETSRVETLLSPKKGEGVYAFALPETPLEPEILLRLLRRAITHAAIVTSPVRLDRMETLAAALDRALRFQEAYRGTLGGTRITLARDRFVEVAREATRQSMRRLPRQEAK